MIIDIQGVFSGFWALRGRKNLKRILEHKGGEKVIFNFRQTSGLDTLGAKAIMESIPREVSGAFLAGASSVMELIHRHPESKRFQIFEEEQEMIDAFGKDFIETHQATEQRNSPRLQTALPLEFYYEDHDEPVKFKAIVTNLSESGLMAEYIDLKIAEESLNRLNPYDLKTLRLTLFLSKRKALHMEGHVIHRNLDGDQMGIGIKFSNPTLKDQEEIRHFLKLNGMQFEMENSRKEGYLK